MCLGQTAVHAFFVNLKHTKNDRKLHKVETAERSQNMDAAQRTSDLDLQHRVLVGVSDLQNFDFNIPSEHTSKHIYMYYDSRYTGL